MADDPWAKFNPQKSSEDWSKFNPESSPAEQPSDEPSGAARFAGGIAQGAVFDPVTGINQLIEHATDNKIGLPDSVKNWLENYKDKYASGTAGEIGQDIGTIGSLLVPGGLAVKGLSKIPAAGRSLTALERVARGAGIGAAGAVTQPVDESKGDFSRQKGIQALGGTLGGGLVGPISGPATAGGTAYIASEMVHKLGWPAAMGIFAALGTSLASLAHHHGMGQAAMKAKNVASKVFDRPGAQYAAGRAAGAGEQAESVQEQLDVQ